MDLQAQVLFYHKTDFLSSGFAKSKTNTKKRIHLSSKRKKQKKKKGGMIRIWITQASALPYLSKPLFCSYPHICLTLTMLSHTGEASAEGFDRLLSSLTALIGYPGRSGAIISLIFGRLLSAFLRRKNRKHRKPAGETQKCSCKVCGK